jgi:hypothetical protein
MLSVLDFAALRKVVDHDAQHIIRGTAVIMMIMMMILGCLFCKVLSVESCGVSLRAASCQTLIADLEFAVPETSGHKQRYPHKSLIVYKSAIRSKRILDESNASSLLLACICAALCALHEEVLANSCGCEVKLVHGQKEPGSSKLQPILCSLMKPPSRYLHLRCNLHQEDCAMQTKS